MSKLKTFNGTSWDTVNGQITGDTLPIGSIVPYGSRFAPTNWLVCDGSAISRTTYSELFAIIGTSFGSGDGTTTFNLPNLKGKVPVGYNSSDSDFDTMGETGGEKTHTLTIDEMPSHNHDFSGGYGSGSVVERYAYGSVGTANTYGNKNAGGGQAHNNLQPYQVVCYIIKAKQSAGVVANVSNVYSGSQANTYSCNYINDAIMDNYSTTEQIVGCWINGDAIYRKVIDIGSLPNTNTKYVSHGISNLGNVISIKGVGKNPTYNTFIPLPATNPYDNIYSTFIYLDDSNVVIQTNSDHSNFTQCYVIVEYIKDY